MSSTPDSEVRVKKLEFKQVSAWRQRSTSFQ